MQSEVNDGNASGPAPPATGIVSPWVNIALRALDTTVSTSQNLIDRADRLARAGANADANPPAAVQPASSAVWGSGRAALAYGIAVATAVQRSAVTLLTDGWRQWFGAVGAIASMGKRGEPAASQPSQPVPWTQPVHATAASERRAQPTRQRKPARASGEHAMASAGTKRRASRKPSARRAR